MDGLSLDKIISNKSKNITIETFISGLTYHDIDVILTDIQLQLDYFISKNKKIEAIASNIFYINGRFLLISQTESTDKSTILRQLISNDDESSFDSEWKKIENTELWDKYPFDNYTK